VRITIVYIPGDVKDLHLSIASPERQSQKIVGSKDATRYTNALIKVITHMLKGFHAKYRVVPQK
jgi:hypothetical protein